MKLCRLCWVAALKFSIRRTDSAAIAPINSASDIPSRWGLINRLRTSVPELVCQIEHETHRSFRDHIGRILTKPRIRSLESRQGCRYLDFLKRHKRRRYVKTADPWLMDQVKGRIGGFAIGRMDASVRLAHVRQQSLRGRRVAFAKYPSEILTPGTAKSMDDVRQPSWQLRPLDQSK